MVEYENLDFGGVTRYAYDCFGRRISKTLDSNGSPTRTRYVNGGQMNWQVLQERSGTGSGPNAGELLAQYVYGNYVDEPILMRRDAVAPAGAEDYYFFADDLFNVTCLTDATGAVVERYRYGDYGLPTMFTATGSTLYESAVGNTRLWNAREFDRETSLYHYRTRYLEPSWGRFTTRDTIGVWGDGANVGNGLANVGGNPWTYLDPSGEARVRGTTADIVYMGWQVGFGWDLFSAFGGILSAGLQLAGGFELVADCRSRQYGIFATIEAGGYASATATPLARRLGAEVTIEFGLAYNSSLASWASSSFSDFAGEAGVSISNQFARANTGASFAQGWSYWRSVRSSSWGVSRKYSAVTGTAVSLSLVGSWSLSLGPSSIRPMSNGLLLALCSDGPQCSGLPETKLDFGRARAAFESQMSMERARIENELMWDNAQSPAQFTLCRS